MADYNEYLSGFVFLADNTKLVVVQFKMLDEVGFEKHRNQSEYLDVHVPSRVDANGTLVRDGIAENLLYPTQVVDIARQALVPNPLSLYLKHIKEPQYDAFGNKKESSVFEEGNSDKLRADMDMLLMQHRE